MTDYIASEVRRRHAAPLSATGLGPSFAPTISSPPPSAPALPSSSVSSSASSALDEAMAHEHPERKMTLMKALWKYVPSGFEWAESLSGCFFSLVEWKECLLKELLPLLSSPDELCSPPAPAPAPPSDPRNQRARRALIVGSLAMAVLPIAAFFLAYYLLFPAVENGGSWEMKHSLSYSGVVAVVTVNAIMIGFVIYATKCDPEYSTPDEEQEEEQQRQQQGPQPPAAARTPAPTDATATLRAHQEEEEGEEEEEAAAAGRPAASPDQVDAPAVRSKPTRRKTKAD